MRKLVGLLFIVVFVCRCQWSWEERERKCRSSRDSLHVDDQSSQIDVWRHLCWTEWKQSLRLFVVRSAMWNKIVERERTTGEKKKKKKKKKKPVFVVVERNELCLQRRIRSKKWSRERIRRSLEREKKQKRLTMSTGSPLRRENGQSLSDLVHKFIRMTVKTDENNKEQTFKRKHSHSKHQSISSSSSTLKRNTQRYPIPITTTRRISTITHYNVSPIPTQINDGQRQEEEEEEEYAWAEQVRERRKTLKLDTQCWSSG